MERKRKLRHVLVSGFFAGFVFLAAGVLTTTIHAEQTENNESQVTEQAQSDEQVQQTDSDENVSDTPVTAAYQTHVQTDGWLDTVSDGEISGTTGQSRRVEAFRIELQNADNQDIRYRAHVQYIGWQDYVNSGEQAGTTKQSKQIEAVQIQLQGKTAETYDIYYRVHSAGYGWLAWTKNNDIAGTTGLGRRIEAMQIQLLLRTDTGIPNTSGQAYICPLVQYQSHVQKSGWQAKTNDGQISGTTGKELRLEAVKIHLYEPKYAGDIEYSGHVQKYGWQSWSRNGNPVGTTGQGLRLESLRIRLTGEMAEHYDVYYRAHVQSYGWLGWAKNGENAGSQDFGKRMEAYEVVLVDKGESKSSTIPAFVQNQILYQAHVQKIGWQSAVSDGKTSGTTGKYLNMEALKLTVVNPSNLITGTLKYRVHVQKIGWQNYVTSGQTAGTTGKGLRIEAVQMYLTEEAANRYDVYYRIHSGGFGWFDWAKNNVIAGTTGMSCGIQAIEIKIQIKVQRKPAGHASVASIRDRMVYDMNGQTISGWQTINGNRIYYSDTDGSLTYGQKYIDHYWYCFDLSSAKRLTGFQYLDERYNSTGPKFVYYNREGQLQKGQFYVNKALIYADIATGAIYRTELKNVPYFNQRDARWAHRVFGSGTIASSGCFTCVATSVVNFLKGANYTPVNLAETLYNAGYYNGRVEGTIGSAWKYIANKYSLSYRSGLSAATMAQELMKGNLIGAGVSQYFINYPYTHEILLYGYNNGYTNVYDPLTQTKCGTYSIDFIASMPSWDPNDKIDNGPFYSLGVK